MQLFKNECLQDTGFAAHDLVFRAPLFGPRYGRHPLRPRRVSAVSRADEERSPAMPLNAWAELNEDAPRVRWSDID